MENCGGVGGMMRIAMVNQFFGVLALFVVLVSLLGMWLCCAFDWIHVDRFVWGVDCVGGLWAMLVDGKSVLWR